MARETEEMRRPIHSLTMDVAGEQVKRRQGQASFYNNEVTHTMIIPGEIFLHLEPYTRRSIPIDKAGVGRLRRKD